MKTKPFYQSKIFIVNCIVLALAVIELLTHDVLNALGIAPANQASVLILLGAFTALLNVFLRMITNSAVSFKPNKTLVIIGFMLLSSFSFAQVKDSALIHDAIVTGVNAGLAVLPQSPATSFIQTFSLIFGSAITAVCIFFFGHRHGKSAKK